MAHRYMNVEIGNEVALGSALYVMSGPPLGRAFDTFV
jgi:hypothetical protein